MLLVFGPRGKGNLMRPRRRPFVTALVVAAVLIPAGTADASAGPDRATARRPSPLVRISPTQATFAVNPPGVDFSVTGSLIGLVGGGTGTWQMAGDFIQPGIGLGPVQVAAFRGSMFITFSRDRPGAGYLVAGQCCVNGLMTWSGTGLPSNTAVAVTGALLISLRSCAGGCNGVVTWTPRRR
jgi:hypothetical protein